MSVFADSLFELIRDSRLDTQTIFRLVAFRRSYQKQHKSVYTQFIEEKALGNLKKNDRLEDYLQAGETISNVLYVTKRDHNAVAFSEYLQDKIAAAIKKMSAELSINWVQPNHKKRLQEKIQRLRFAQLALSRSKVLSPKSSSSPTPRSKVPSPKSSPLHSSSATRSLSQSPPSRSSAQESLSPRSAATRSLQSSPSRSTQSSPPPSRFGFNTNKFNNKFNKSLKKGKRSSQIPLPKKRQGVFV